jgi:hypothetical protein
MGSRNRTKTRSTGCTRLQDLPNDKRRRRIARKVSGQNDSTRIHLTIKIPVCVTILLRQKERWKITTGARLSEAKQPHCAKSASITTDSTTHIGSGRCMDLFQIGRTMRIPQRPDQGRRSMESRIQNQIRILRTTVLRSVGRSVRRG